MLSTLDMLDDREVPARALRTELSQLASRAGVRGGATGGGAASLPWVPPGRNGFTAGASGHGLSPGPTGYNSCSPASVSGERLSRPRLHRPPK